MKERLFSGRKIKIMMQKAKGFLHFLSESFQDKPPCFDIKNPADFV